jgi:hypothetical protein
MVVLNQQPVPRPARRDDLIALPSTWVIARIAARATLSCGTRDGRTLRGGEGSTDTPTRRSGQASGGRWARRSRIVRSEASEAETWRRSLACTRKEERALPGLELTARVPECMESARPGAQRHGDGPGQSASASAPPLRSWRGVRGVRAEEGKRFGCSRRDIDLARRLSVVDGERRDHWTAGDPPQVLSSSASAGRADAAVTWRSPSFQAAGDPR